MKRPIAGANVTSLSQPPGQQSFIILTNNQGLSYVPCLAPGGYKVRVSHAGYQSTIVGFNVSNQTITAQATLASSQAGFPTVWVIYGGIGAVPSVSFGQIIRNQSTRKPKCRRKIFLQLHGFLDGSE
jgi:hypothetical protein